MEKAAQQQVNNMVEVKIGQMAQVGDLIVRPDKREMILNDLTANMLNEFEPNGYSSESYKRYRAK